MNVATLPGNDRRRDIGGHGRQGATRDASRQNPWSARRARLLRLPRAFAHELLIGLVGRFGRAATLLRHAALNNPLLP